MVLRTMEETIKFIRIWWLNLEDMHDENVLVNSDTLFLYG